jgi:perosamine synthetase
MLEAAGIGEGDVVLTTPFSFIASANAVRHAGAEVAFADIRPGTCNLDPDAVREVLAERGDVTALLPVHLYGLPADMDAFRSIAREYDLRLFEDAAQAHGATFDGESVGSIADAGAFSFYPTKNMTTGEGGMLTTDDAALHRRVLQLRDHGRPPGDRFFQNSEVAFKYKMSGTAAAVGLAQTERINELIDKKRQIFNWYAQRLSDIPGLTLNPTVAGAEGGYWMTTISLDERFAMDSQQLMARFDERGIDTRPFFRPLSTLPAYRDRPEAAAARARNEAADRISYCGVNLPSPLNLTRPQADHVSEACRSILGAAAG